MDFERFKKINDEKVNVGELENPTVVMPFTNEACGDDYQVYLKVVEGRIEDARFTTTGCGFSLAALSVGLDLVKGKDLTVAEALTAEQIQQAFEFPPRRSGYPETAAEVIRAAARAARQ